VKNRIPQVINVPVIVKNMKTFGSLSKAELLSAVTWGSGPLIVIKNLSTFTCGGVAAANGCFRSANPDQVELDSETVDNFEKDAYGSGSDTTSSGKKVFIVGTTLLHELCHWGNFQHGVTETAEAGVGFEVATYGRNTG
jgi:hypothetical protein